MSGNATCTGSVRGLSFRGKFVRAIDARTGNRNCSEGCDFAANRVVCEHHNGADAMPESQTVSTTTTPNGTHVVTDVNPPGSMGIASVRLKDIMNTTAMAAFICLAFMMWQRGNQMQDRILDQQDSKAASLDAHIATQIEVSRQNIAATQENTSAIRKLESTVTRKGGMID